MSSPTNSPVTVEVVRQAISSNLNSTLMFVFLAGIYITVFVHTIYLYETQKENKNQCIAIALSALCAITVTILGIQWQFLNSIFVNNSNLKEFTLLWGILTSVLQFAGYILADGLLLWRCYHMLDRSKLLMSFPLFMYVCEIALCIISLVLYGMVDFVKDSQQLSVPSLIINGALNGVTAITSTSASLIICHKIFTSVKDQLPMKRRYKHIIRMLIESSAMYSISGILITIDSIPRVISSTPIPVKETWGNISSYFLGLNAIATGLAPTLMVAQICLSAKALSINTEQTHHISTLEFNHPNTVEDMPRGSRSSLDLYINSKNERHHV